MGCRASSKCSADIIEPLKWFNHTCNDSQWGEPFEYNVHKTADGPSAPRSVSGFTANGTKNNTIGAAGAMQSWPTPKQAATVSIPAAPHPPVSWSQVVAHGSGGSPSMPKAPPKEPVIAAAAESMTHGDASPTEAAQVPNLTQQRKKVRKNCKRISKAAAANLDASSIGGGRPTSTSAPDSSQPLNESKEVIGKKPLYSRAKVAEKWPRRDLSRKASESVPTSNHSRNSSSSTYNASKSSNTSISGDKLQNDYKPVNVVPLTVPERLPVFTAQAQLVTEPAQWTPLRVSFNSLPCEIKELIIGYAVEYSGKPKILFDAKQARANESEIEALQDGTLAWRQYQTRKQFETRFEKPSTRAFRHFVYPSLELTQAISAPPTTIQVDPWFRETNKSGAYDILQTFIGLCRFGGREYFRRNTFQLNLEPFMIAERRLDHDMTDTQLREYEHHSQLRKWPDVGDSRTTFALQEVRHVVLTNHDYLRWERVAFVLQGCKNLETVTLDLRGPGSDARCMHKQMVRLPAAFRGRHITCAGRKETKDGRPYISNRPVPRFRVRLANEKDDAPRWNWFRTLSVAQRMASHPLPDHIWLEKDEYVEKLAHEEIYHALISKFRNSNKDEAGFIQPGSLKFAHHDQANLEHQLNPFVENEIRRGVERVTGLIIPPLPVVDHDPEQSETLGEDHMAP